MHHRQHCDSSFCSLIHKTASFKCKYNHQFCFFVCKTPAVYNPKSEIFYDSSSSLIVSKALNLLVDGPKAADSSLLLLEWSSAVVFSWRRGSIPLSCSDFISLTSGCFSQ